MLCQMFKKAHITKFHKGCTGYIRTMSWWLTCCIWMDVFGCHGGSTSFEQWGYCCRKVRCTLCSTCASTDLLTATMSGQKLLISAKLILTFRRHTWLVSQNIWKRSIVSLNLDILPDDRWLPIWQLRPHVLSRLSHGLNLTIWKMICPLKPTM